MLPPGYEIVLDSVHRGVADAAAAYLESEGIEAVVETEDASGMLPCEHVSGVRVLVQAEDAERARALLRIADARGHLHPVNDDDE